MESKAIRFTFMDFTERAKHVICCIYSVDYYMTLSWQILVIFGRNKMCHACQLPERNEAIFSLNDHSDVKMFWGANLPT